MLASDLQQNKLKFPLYIEPKIDGVRGMNINNIYTGRSLKPPKNYAAAVRFSAPAYFGFDGEMAAEHETHPDLCRLTTSALSTISGERFLLWHVFDYIVPETRYLPYILRVQALRKRVNELITTHPVEAQRLRIIPILEVNSWEELVHQDTIWLAKGFEGTIVRDINGMYKEGRSTAIEGGLLRLKRFADAEAVVLRIEEGDANENEAVVNELGRTSRSTHKENMVPNGMVGALICLDVKSQKEIRVAPGRMTHKERKEFFESPHLIVRKTIKYKTFLKGVKDLPRFPTYQCIRDEGDIDPN